MKKKAIEERVFKIIAECIRLTIGHDENPKAIVVRIDQEKAVESVMLLISDIVKEIVGELDILESKVQENNKKWLIENDHLIDGEESGAVKAIHFLEKRIRQRAKELGIKI